MTCEGLKRERAASRFDSSSSRESIGSDGVETAGGGREGRRMECGVS